MLNSNLTKISWKPTTRSPIKVKFSECFGSPIDIQTPGEDTPIAIAGDSAFRDSILTNSLENAVVSLYVRIPDSNGIPHGIQNTGRQINFTEQYGILDIFKKTSQIISMKFRQKNLLMEEIMHNLLFIKPSDKIWGYSPYYGPGARRIPEPSTVGHANLDKSACFPGSNADCFEEEEWNTSELAHGFSWETTMVVLDGLGTEIFVENECVMYLKIPATLRRPSFFGWGCWALLLWRHPKIEKTSQILGM